MSCKAQTFPLFNPPNDFDVDGAYYKDLDNDLTKLVGTWQYTNGNQTFKIILKKKIQDTINSPQKGVVFTEDVLYGEYNYVDIDGSEIINTLSNIDNYTNDVSQHLVYGNYIKSKMDFPPCNDCIDGERRVKVLIDDPSRNYFDYDMEIRHIPGDALLGTTEQIKIKIKRTDMAPVPEGQPTDDRLPLNQEFVLDKL